MSQTHILNFFPGSIYSGRILKTFGFFASRQKNGYVSNPQIWLNRLYFKVSNSKEKNCLTIDTRDINKIGPRKFSTFAENGEIQTYFYNRNKSDVYSDSYLAKHVVSLRNIKFFIEKTNFNCFDPLYKSFEFDQKISNLNLPESEEHSKSGKESIKKIMEDFQNIEQSQKIPFLESDEEQQPEEQIIEKKQNSCQKTANRHGVKYTATRIKYSPIRIKSRNFLSNISYTGINKNGFYNESFILDAYFLLVKNLNPFSLQRKLSDKLKQEMVYMLWRECIPIEFYRHICEEKNFVYLNGRDVGQPGVLEIVGNFIDQGKENLRLLQEHLV